MTTAAARVLFRLNREVKVFNMNCNTMPAGLIICWINILCKEVELFALFYDWFNYLLLGAGRLELPTFRLSNEHSTIELRALEFVCWSRRTRTFA